jgi:SRSO17 transposase
LEALADDVFASLARADRRALAQCYLRGLLLDGRRKSIEPMAARLGEVHYQALHHFVAVFPWDWRPVRRRLAEMMTGGAAADRVGGRRHRLSQGRQLLGGGAAPVLGHAGARPPTASFRCRSTRSPSRPAARFEGRGWVGWHHHVTLVLVAHGFVTLERLRSPNLVASA